MDPKNSGRLVGSWSHFFQSPQAQRLLELGGPLQSLRPHPLGHRESGEGMCSGSCSESVMGRQEPGLPGTLVLGSFWFSVTEQ